METNNISQWKPRTYPALESARKLVARFNYRNVSQRIGVPCKVLTVTETVSEKARRVFSECDNIYCKI